MAGFTQLLVLATIMFISTFLLGSLPLTLSTSLSARRSHQLSIFSVGLLIGAALTIVIPEGVDTIYTSLDPSLAPNTTSTSTSNTTSTASPLPSIQHSTHGGHNTTIGLTLMAGFLLMFLIDQLTKLSTRTTSTTTTPVLRGSLSFGKSNCSQTDALLSESSGDDCPEEAAGDLENLVSNKTHPPSHHALRSSTKSHSFSTVIGLLTHSVADGIALGASSTHTAHLTPKSSKLTLDVVIFLALMVHKAPAAFGLVSVLMSEGLSKRFVRNALLAFSLAAPLGSLMTWTVLALIHRIRSGSHPNDPDLSPDPPGIQWWIGVTLLFSGGTFLFVATHALESTTSRPVDLCFPQVLPPISYPHPSSSHDQRLPSTNNNHLTSSCPTTTLQETDPAEELVIGPLLTSALMVAGVVFPWTLTQIVGGHH